MPAFFRLVFYFQDGQNDHRNKAEHRVLKGGQAMTHLLVRHKVADFTKWKPVYDGHQAMRQKAGLREKNLLRSIDNPNEVILLFEAEDLKRAQAFTESSDLREAMQKAGVIGKPDILFLN